MAQHPTRFWPLATDAVAALKARPWPIVAAGTGLVVGMGVLSGSSVLFDELATLRGLGEEVQLAFHLGVMPLLTILFEATWLVGLHVALRTVRREALAWPSVLALVGPSLVIDTLSRALVVPGVFACVLPSLIVAVGLAYAQWFLVDRSLGPLAALSASWDATRGERLGVFWLLFRLLILLILGVFALPLVLAVFLLMGASSHAQLAARIFSPRAQPDDASPPALEAPAAPVPIGLWVVAVLVSLATVGLWDADLVRFWLFPALSRALPTLAEAQIQAAIAGAIVAPALVVLVVGLRIHTRHRPTALDARGLWLDATPRDGRLVPWRDVQWFDVVGDGVRLKLRGQWALLGPVLTLDEARRPEAVALLEAHGVRRRDG